MMGQVDEKKYGKYVESKVFLQNLGFEIISHEEYATLRALLRESVEDGERLAQNHWYESEEDGKEYCNMCGFQFKGKFTEHDDDCPITLHAAFVKKVGKL